MRRILGAVVVAIIVFFVVFGSTLAMNVSAGTQSSDFTLVCQNSPVTLGWLTAFAPDGTVRVVGIEISNVDPACDGQKVMVATYSTASTMNGLFRGTLVTGTSDVDEYYDGAWGPAESGSGPNAADVNTAQIVFQKDWTEPEAAASIGAI